MDRPGPLHRVRHLINRQLQDLPVLTGDIFVRLGDSRFCGIPFEKLVARATHSEFSHASVAIRLCGEVFLLEVNEWGTLLLRCVDWLDYVAVENFAVYRYPLTGEQRERLRQEILACAQDDADYDFTFSDPWKFYCTESVAHVYARIGLELGRPRLIRDVLPKWAYALLVPLNGLVSLLTSAGLPLQQPLHFVGNSREGILSTPRLREIYRYPSRPDRTPTDPLS